MIWRTGEESRVVNKMSAAVAAAAAAVVVPVAAAFGALPVNPDLPVSFGVNSRGGDRLKGEFIDAAVYSTVLPPKTIEAAARGVRPSVKPLWSGVPKAGDRCEEVRAAKFPRGFTLLATIRTDGAETARIMDNEIPGGGKGWIFDIIRNRPRVVIEGGNTQFFGEPIPAGKAVHLAFTYPTSGDEYGIFVEGKRHRPLPPPALKPARRGMELLADSPARVWTEAYPVGNGRLGAMVFGGDAVEKIQLNEDTIWSGGPGRNLTQGLSPELFAAARKAIFEERYRDEKNILPKEYRGSSRYQLFGTLEIDFGADAETEEYERSLSLDDAVARVELTRGGVRYERETFASLADDVVVCRIRASEPGTLGFTARRVPPWKNHAATAERDRLVYRAHDVAARYIAG